MLLKLAGIKRQCSYSPNHIENDTLLLLKTAEELVGLGAEVKIYDEEEVSNKIFSEDIIFSMAQGVKANEVLDKYISEGKMIINPPRSVLNCHRANMVRILAENGLPFPQSIIVDVNEADKVHFNELGTNKIWIKRGDVHAEHREDVTLCYCENEKQSILREFARRGIEKAVLQRHVEGDVIKFYSINHYELFHWYYLNGVNHTKFNAKELKRLADESADALGLEIYGGDAVISENGGITLIDVNDWPSFAPIREKASKHIAKLIYKKAVEYVERKVI